MKKVFQKTLVMILIFFWVFSAFSPVAQAAIALRGTPQIGSATNGGDVTLTFDTTPQTGDVVFLYGGRGNSTDAFAWGPNTAGYATTTVINSTGPKFGVWYKVMGGTPDTTVVGEGGGDAASGVVYGSYVINGSTLNPDIFDQVASSTGQLTQVPNGPNIVTQTPEAWVITHYAGGAKDTSRGTVSNYTIMTGASVDETDDYVSEAAYREIASPGTEDPPAWSSWTSSLGGGITIALKPKPTTFLGNDTDPGSNPTIAPGAATTTVDTFNLKASYGSNIVSAATVTLATGTGTSTAAVLITNSGNTTTYCADYNSSSDTVNLTGCNLPVTNASTTFNVRIKPLTHSAMPAPPGNTYAVTATITSITATTTTSGTDTTSDTVTIDNASPNGATATSGTAGDANVTLNWTASNSSDFDTTSGSVILRWAAGVAGPSVPAEGNSSYVAGNTIATSTVACVISSAASASLSKIDGSGGDTGCTTTALTNGQQYTYKVFQRDTRGNYDVGVNIGTFTPNASLTFTIDVPSVTFVGGLTPGTPVSTSSVLTVNVSNSSGYNITINRASTTPTLFLAGDINTTIADNPNSNNWTAPAATSTAGPSAIWTVGTTLGLGFRLKLTGTVANTYSTVWWGTDDASGNAKYSGISTSTAAQKIADTTLGSGSNENTVVEYKVDVSASQKTGAYTSSPVTYTALAN